MEISSVMLPQFLGGQMEVKNQCEKYLYRGEIEKISEADGLIEVKFRWIAMGVGFPVPERWINRPNIGFNMIFSVYVPTLLEDGCVSFYTETCTDDIEFIVLFPPGGNLLDPRNVEGLLH